MNVLLQLIKPRIALLVLLVAMASFYVADPSAVSWWRFAMMSVTTAVLASGIFALNSWIERDTDLVMDRTRGRPLPSGRMRPTRAFTFGMAATMLAIGLQAALLGLATAAVGLFTAVVYVLIYTPLKRRTVLHTVIGALSGATPPLIGWSAARGSLDLGAWILAGVLFLWQFPHFLSIEALYREDYERAGIRVLPATEPTGTAAATVMVAALALLAPWSVVQFLAGLSDEVSLVVSLAAAAAFLAAGLIHLVQRSRASARLVLRVSVIYLPVVFAVLVFVGRR